MLSHYNKLLNEIYLVNVIIVYNHWPFCTTSIISIIFNKLKCYYLYQTVNFISTLLTFLSFNVNFSSKEWVLLYLLKEYIQKLKFVTLFQRAASD